MAEFPAILNLGDLTRATGFRLDGAAGGDRSSISVSSAGDVNGDGLADLIVGANGADPNGRSDAGSSYVVFGRAGGFEAPVDLASLTPATGFRLDGAAAVDFSGFPVSSAGDVNGDGLADLIVGASGADPDGRTNAGSRYVVFGRADGFEAPVDLGSLTPATGFRLDGAAASDFSGGSVSSAGDVNGDGLADLIVGASGADPNGRTNAGSSYVVFGRAGGFNAPVDLASLTRATGFRLDGAAAGDRSGYSVSSAGDVNGDGFADLIVGAYRADPNGMDAAGSSYVVFGRAGGFEAPVDLGSLTPATGFRLDGAAERDYSGFSVSSAGDVNGDGFADLIVGAYRADPNGRTNAGSSYVVFGRARGFEAPVDLASLTPATGFRLDGMAGGDQSGFSVSSAGDVNGDGFADLIVGSASADPNGRDAAGSSYVVFGRAPDAAVTRTGTESDNTIRGGAFNDRLIGLAGDDTLTGGGGNDALVGGAGADTLIGEAGIDTAVYTASDAGVSVDLASSGAQSGGEAQGDTLSGIENVQGSAFDDMLIGDGNANVLLGLAGDDSLSGGGGADRIDGGLGVDAMSGGAGDDIFIVDNSGDTVGEASGEGRDTVFVTAAEWTLGAGQSVEFLRVNNTADGVSLTGNELDQFLYGGRGDDRLDGGGGSDRLYGGMGDDTYVIGDGRAVVIENAGGGTDTVEAGVNVTLRSNVENLTLTGTGALRGTGNALDNVLTGNGSANVLIGGAGDDRLTGGLGKDQLTGGDGTDTFVFLTIEDSLDTARDLILGFTVADDVIDLSQIDANANLDGNQAFRFVMGGAFLGESTAGQLIARKAGNYTLVQGDTDGDGMADLGILVRSEFAVGEGDFLL